MEQSRILGIINTKIAEHKFEVAGSEVEIQKLQKQLKGTKYDIEFAGKIMVLKDKALFHRGAMMVLEDLKKDIENVN